MGRRQRLQGADLLLIAAYSDGRVPELAKKTYYSPQGQGESALLVGELKSYEAVNFKQNKKSSLRPFSVEDLKESDVYDTALHTFKIDQGSPGSMQGRSGRVSYDIYDLEPNRTGWAARALSGLSSSDLAAFHVFDHLNQLAVIFDRTTELGEILVARQAAAPTSHQLLEATGNL